MWSSTLGSSRPFIYKSFGKILSLKKSRFTSGTLGIVNCSRYAAFGHDQRLEVFGRDGMVRIGYG